MCVSTVDRLSELLLGSSVDIPLQCHHNHMEMLETSESLKILCVIRLDQSVSLLSCHTKYNNQ